MSRVTHYHAFCDLGKVYRESGPCWVCRSDEIVAYDNEISSTPRPPFTGRANLCEACARTITLTEALQGE